MIEKHGFVPLARKSLTAAEVKHGAPRTRGGNWGPGPDDHLGGLPAIVLVDLRPEAPTTLAVAAQAVSAGDQCPHAVSKKQIRRPVNESIAPRHPINGVHSSDYGAEAHHFLHTFAPELVPMINEKIAELRGQAATAPPGRLTTWEQFAALCNA